MAKITLYQFEECPFCAKVRAVLQRLDLPFNAIIVPPDREDPIRKELFQKSGVPTMPVISVDGKYIGDSGAIIRYLEENFSKKQAEKDQNDLVIEHT